MKPDCLSPLIAPLTAPVMAPSRRRVGLGSLSWLRLLIALLDLGGPDCDLCEHAEHDWASATFTGTRHSVTLRFTGYAGLTAAEDFMLALPDHEFDLPGQIVADASILAVDQSLLLRPALTLTCELLLVEAS